MTPGVPAGVAQWNRACYIGLLEPFRDLENATFLEVMSFFIALGEDPETFFGDCDPEAPDELGELFSLE